MSDIEKLQGKETGDNNKNVKPAKKNLYAKVEELERRIKQLEGEKDNPAMKSGFKRVPLKCTLENLRELQNEYVPEGPSVHGGVS